MAEYGVLIKPFLSLNGTDISAYIRSENLSKQIEGQDDTESGDTSRTEAPGLIVNSADFELNQEFTVVDGLIGPLLQNRTVFAVEHRHDTAVVGVTNPKHTGSCFIKSYNPSAGKIGDQSVARLTLGFTTAFTRATA